VNRLANRLANQSAIEMDCSLVTMFLQGWLVSWLVQEWDCRWVHLLAIELVNRLANQSVNQSAIQMDCSLVTMSLQAGGDCRPCLLAMLRWTFRSLHHDLKLLLTQPPRLCVLDLAWSSSLLLEPLQVASHPRYLGHRRRVLE